MGRMRPAGRVFKVPGLQHIKIKLQILAELFKFEKIEKVKIAILGDN
jgi:hypothetical protein